MPEPQPEGPQRYRLRIFDGNYEVLDDRLFTVVLDIEGPGMTEIESLLNRRIRALARVAGVPANRMHEVRMQVHDRYDDKVMDWVIS